MHCQGAIVITLCWVYFGGDSDSKERRVFSKKQVTGLRFFGIVAGQSQARSGISTWGNV